MFNLVQFFFFLIITSLFKCSESNPKNKINILNLYNRQTLEDQFDAIILFIPNNDFDIDENIIIY